ncbi:hypothetical protein [Anditalea andensis]|uniref:Uncharacterized protein n=1 Tax=Anditalea andensis TaxID=1048983 RepID=A0A074L4W8_9BACT|nr:hypothetical protein [Anditalea andensis]KEO75525.1 hypothetical protein EL17_01365 [Anditalea andensis]
MDISEVSSDKLDQKKENMKGLLYLPTGRQITLPTDTTKVAYQTKFYNTEEISDETLNFKFLMPAIEVAKSEDLDFIIGFDVSMNRIILAYKNLEDKFQAFNAHQQAALICDHVVQTVTRDRPYGDSGLLLVKSMILSDQLDSIATKNGVPVKVSHSGVEALKDTIATNDDSHETVMAFDDRNTVILDIDLDKNPDRILELFHSFFTSLLSKDLSILDKHIDIQTRYRLYLEKTFNITRDTSIKKLFDKFRTKPPEDDLADELILITDYKKQTFQNKLTGRKGKHDFAQMDMVQLEYSSGLKITVESFEAENRLAIHLSKYTNFTFKPKFAETRKALHDSLLKTVVTLGKV